MTEYFYGREGDEELSNSAIELLSELLREQVLEQTDSFDEAANRITWPVRIWEYKRKQLPPVKYLADTFLEILLEWLDEEWGDPNEDPTDPTTKMKEAAFVLANAISQEYEVWACEPTGNYVDYTRAEVKDLLGNAMDHLRDFPREPLE